MGHMETVIGSRGVVEESIDDCCWQWSIIAKGGARSGASGHGGGDGFYR